MLLSVAVLALLATVQGRAVNISNTWVLPEEGFPVFYRYFRDRISWYEADAVCQFHHANLVTVDTTAQYDAVRAYLKELDISSAVWVGLIRSNPDGDFTWTDYRGLSGEGYWSSAPDARAAPLCAAADPAADYRWEARVCGGPSVASFICELPVPQWALGNEGCMVRALPALTILYLPESAAVQLTADCGMAGVKKVQCTGNVKREDLLKELSCAVDEDLPTTNLVSTGSVWSATTDSTYTEQDTTSDIVTEETISTEHESIDINQPKDITATSIPRFVYSQTQYRIPTKSNNLNKLKSVIFSKNIILADSQDNNLHSNHVPRTADEDNVLTNDQLEKLEDERHKQHKMLHEEIARVGNVDNIFSQPTDHFIPPLVMAKAKISDDMTVLSLAEKHAQQLAEKQFIKQNLNNDAIDQFYSEARTSSKITVKDIDKPLITTTQLPVVKENKQDILKYHTPKKYVNEKYIDVKSKISKYAESKTAESNKQITHFTSGSTTKITTKKIESLSTTAKSFIENSQKIDFGVDSGMDLTVILNESSSTSEVQQSYSGDVPKLETIKNNNLKNRTVLKSSTIETSTSSPQIGITSSPKPYLADNITMQHDVIKITILDDDDKVNNTAVFEVTTKVPVFKDNDLSSTMIPLSTRDQKDFLNTEPQVFTTLNHDFHSTTTSTKIAETGSTTTPVAHTIIISTNLPTENVTTVPSVRPSTETKMNADIVTTIDSLISLNKTEHSHELENAALTTSSPIMFIETDNNTIVNNITISKEVVEKSEINSADYHDMVMNITDNRHSEDDITEDDFQSPLLSGVSEPVHRPPRTRRPQQPNRNKFNPFRILG